MELSYIPLRIDTKYAFELHFIDERKNVRKKYDIEIDRERSAHLLRITDPRYAVYVKKPHSSDIDTYIVLERAINSVRYLPHSLFTMIYSMYEYNPEYRKFNDIL